MPIPTPFHERAAARCQSHEWRDWAGYLAASTYEIGHEREYYAIRQSAALIDVSPLFKYEVSGTDALRLVNRAMTRNVARCAVGQIMYSPWCDEAGQVIDDGTVARLAPDRFRITAAEPNLGWFRDVGYGMDAVVADVSQDLAALALQGPLARKVLLAAATSAPRDCVAALRYFRLTETTIAGVPVTITRTGYTGDLGYELWVRPEQALRLWDGLMAAGQGYGLAPAGMVALDIARIEAGLLLAGVDYIPAPYSQIASQTSSPFELGLDWAVAPDKGDFVGRQALAEEKRRGSHWQFVGLHVHWESLERLFSAVNLPPRVAGRASRQAVPIYRYGRQIGQATSQAFSPLLKRYIAIGQVAAPHHRPGSQVEIEVTVEHVRQRARATVVPTPFLDLARRLSPSMSTETRPGDGSRLEACGWRPGD